MNLKVLGILSLLRRKDIIKTLLVMKLTGICMLITCLQAVASGYSQSITLSERNAPLEKVFKKIERQTQYSFVYVDDLLIQAKKVNIELRNASIDQALSTCLRGQLLEYSIIEKVIIIKEKKLAVSTSNTSSELPPPVNIRGRVTDENGNPVASVTVSVKGGTRSTATDDNGEFLLSGIDDNDILIFSSVGYELHEENIKGRNNLIVGLKIAANRLEEAVVIGYGTRKRVNLTGAVSSISGEVLQSRPISNTLSGLQGTIPGMLIQRSSGRPGTEGFDLNVRGYSSTNGGNSPLVLIDGVAGNLDLLNPDDIESISVLKDAAASIYGARAANGVLLVTTKKGKKGSPRINYNNNFAVTKLTGMMKSPNSYEMAVMDNEANIHNGSVPMYTDDMLEKIRNSDPVPLPHPLYGGWMLFFTSTDWLDATFENGFQQKHNINVSGGGNNSTYYLSGSLLDQRGVIKYADDNNKRYNLRMNYDYDISKRIRLESKVFVEHQKRTEIGGLGGWEITEAIFGMPNHPVYTPEGKFFAQGGWGNSVAMAKEGGTATYNTRNINTNFKLIADVATGLKFNVQAGVNYRTDKGNDIAKPVPLYNVDGTIAYYSIANPGESKLTLSNSETIYKNFTAYAEYTKNLAGRHDFSLMAGASHEESDYDWFWTSRQNMVNEDVWSVNLGTGNVLNNGGGEQWAIRSLFSRLSYAFDNKYLVEANLRYDGSSRFQPNKRYGLFPGVSVAWRLSQENFIKDLGLFNDLKLRASYGQTGNQEGIGLYDYMQLISIPGRAAEYPTGYPFGAGGQISSAVLSGMVSLDRTWETLVNKNIGLDATVLASRLNFTFDYFVKRNRNMLIPVKYPSLLGATPPYSNSGEMKTWGFETSLAWKDKAGAVDYSARLILSDAQNEIINYEGADSYVLGLNPIRQGYPFNTYFAYEFDGLIRNQEELDAYKQLGGVPTDIGIGDAKFKDLNGDGQISPYSNKQGDDGDVLNAGTLTPRYIFGVNLGAKYKNFDISLFAQGVGRRTIFRTGEYSIPWSDWWRQPPQFYYGKTWNEDRPDAQFPRLSHGNIRNWNYQASTLQKINGAYIRLKNIQLGYSFPAKLVGKASLSSARIYFSGQDIWELHGVEGGWDPEAASNGFNYPFQRFYSFGLDITF